MIELCAILKLTLKFIVCFSFKVSLLFRMIDKMLHSIFNIVKAIGVDIKNELDISVSKRSL